jgi:hypothetical protein
MHLNCTALCRLVLVSLSAHAMKQTMKR